jgi:uncharacterized protein involved in outer membrane biogenesis
LTLEVVNKIIMKKRFKLFFAGILVISTVLAALVWFAPELINSDVVKEKISIFLATSLNRKVSINGDLIFRTFPRAGFDIRDVVIQDTGDFTQGPFLTFQEARIDLELIPLLNKKVVFSRIVFVKPVLKLPESSVGQTNWDSFLPVQDINETFIKEAGIVILLKLDQLKVEDGKIILVDASNSESLHFNQISFKKTGSGKPKFDLACQVKGKSSVRQGDIIYDGSLTLSGKSTLSFSKNIFSMESGQLNLDLSVSGPFIKKTPLRVNGNLFFDITTDLLTLTDLHAAIGEVDLTGNVKVNAVFENPALTGKINIESHRLRQFYERIPSKSFARGFNEFPEAASMEFIFDSSLSTANITNFQATIDDTIISGDFSIENDFLPRFQGNLKADCIDVDNYMSRASALQWSNSDIFAFLSSLTMDFSLEIQELKYKNQRFHDVQTWLATTGSSIQADPLSARYLGGVVDGGITVESIDNVTVVSTVTRFDNHQGRQLFRLMDKKAVIQSDLSGILKIESHGRTLSDLSTNLSAILAVTMERGSFFFRYDDRDAVVEFSNFNSNLAIENDNFVLSMVFETDKPAQNSHVDMTGRFTLDNKNKTIKISGARTALALTIKTLAYANQHIDLEGIMDFDSKTGSLDANEVAVAGFGLQGEGSILVKDIFNTPVSSGNLFIHPFNPSFLLTRLGIEPPDTGDEAAFTQAMINSDFIFDHNGLSLTPLEITMDDTDLKGIIELKDRENPKIKFMVHGTSIDIDRYLPLNIFADDDRRKIGNPEKEENPSKMNFRSKALALIASADVKGTVTFDSFEVYRLAYQNLFFILSSDKGIYKLDPILSDFYEGNLNGSATLDMGSPDRVYVLKTALSGFACKEPLFNLFGKEIVAGKGDLTFDLTSSGTDRYTIRKNLNGNAIYNVTSGILYGIRIVPPSICPPDERPGLSAEEQGLLKQQEFMALGGSIDIINGIVSMENNRLLANCLDLSCRGRIDLPAKEIDLTITADLPGIVTALYYIKGPFSNMGVIVEKPSIASIAARKIVNAPILLGKETLDLGTKLFELGEESIGDTEGASQIGKGTLEIGKGVLDVGKGILEINQGPTKMGEGVKGVGKGAATIGKGFINTGKNVFNTGVEALEALGRTLKKMFENDPESPRQSQRQQVRFFISTR